MPGKMGKKSDGGNELKRLKEYKKAYGKYKLAAKLNKVDVKKKSTLGALLKKNPKLGERKTIMPVPPKKRG